MTTQVASEVQQVPSLALGASIDIVMPRGKRYVLSHPELPGLRDYYVLAADASAPAPTASELFELSILAQRIGRELAQSRYGDPECYSPIYNAGRTRRRPWPHFHILMARSVGEKRRAFLWLLLKRLLRWRRWPITQRCTGVP